MFTQLDYPYMATVKEGGELVIVERVNIHLHPPRTLVSLSREATQKLLDLLTEKLSTSDAAEHVNAADGEYELVEDNDEMYGTGPHRLQRSHRR